MLQLIYILKQDNWQNNGNFICFKFEKEFFFNDNGSKYSSERGTQSIKSFSLFVLCFVSYLNVCQACLFLF